MDFSNREIAAAFWTMVFILGMVCVPSVRKAAWPLLKMFAQRPFVWVFSLAGAYVVASVLVLEALQLWTWDNLKTTLIWTGGFAFVSMFDIHRIDDDQTYFRKTIRDTINVTVFLLFITGLYSFHLVAELVLMPFVTLIVLMLSVPTKPEHAIAQRFLTCLSTIIGFGYFGYSLALTAVHWRELATLETLREFLIPILLSVMFLPFLYAMSVYTVYENVFISLRWAIKGDGLRRYAKRKALLRFGFNINLLKRWRRMMMQKRPEERDAIRASFDQVKVLHRRERDPPPVPFEDGWSPYAAKEFLSDQGIVSEDWHQLFDEEWRASSKILKIGGSGFGNAITFFVDGTEGAATELTLELTVNKIDQRDEADAAFLAMAQALLDKALGDEAAELLPPSLDDFQSSFGGARIALKTETWTINKFHSYERSLTIEHAAHRPPSPPDFTA